MTIALANVLDALRASLPADVHPNGSDLIGAQPWRGSVAYLHVLHPPVSTEGFAELEALYGWTFPEAIRSFYMLTNGAELYEASLNLFGYVPQFTRYPSARNPFCPKVAVSTFSDTHPAWHNQGYQPIGSFVLYSRSSFVIVDQAARIAVVDKETGEEIRKYRNLETAIDGLCAELTPFWDLDGRRVEPHRQIDSLGMRPGKS